MHYDRPMMLPTQEAHLARLKAELRSRLDVKYRAGAKEHGNELLDLTPQQLLEEAIAENIDQGVYLLSLREKLGY